MSTDKETILRLVAEALSDDRAIVTCKVEQSISSSGRDANGYEIFEPTDRVTLELTVTCSRLTLSELKAHKKNRGTEP